MTTDKTPSKGALWTGRIIMALSVLFFLVDAIMKILKATVSMEGSIQLGWPENLVQAIGFILLGCTILYCIPRTAILGAILLTGYLGGASSIMMRAGVPFYFPIIFGVFAWSGLFLCDLRLRSIIPLRKE